MIVRFIQPGKGDYAEIECPALPQMGDTVEIPEFGPRPRVVSRVHWALVKEKVENPAQGGLPASVQETRRLVPHALLAMNEHDQE